MAIKRKKAVSKCGICKKPRVDPKGFAARLAKLRLCVSCALSLVSRLS